ncbi:MAG: hypothetical protein IT174_08175 [Acidobacteria bacterium]|nr:hypothetical protein [Acidobacteriota bacterium]
MKKFSIWLISFAFLSATAIQAQNKFNGYSYDVGANETDNCSYRFLPPQDRKNNIEVFLPGTDLKKPATGITACELSSVTGNRVAPNSEQKWCFQGPEELYEVRLSTGESFLWPTMSGRNIGFYNLKDFRPLRRIEGPTPKYVFSEPADYTKAFRNALMIMATRRGGTLFVPDGDYVVGTTDGNTRDPSYQGLTITSGVTISGASGAISNPTNNMPDRMSAARIRLRNNNQAIFRIGGCTNGVTIRNIELLGNSALAGEAPRDSTGTYGIEAIGRWSFNSRTKVQTANTSKNFRFEDIVFQNFDTGIILHNANTGRCNAAEQLCTSWQFDFVRVDHGHFVNNKTGISMDSFNTDWTIANSQFHMMAANAPGIGIRIKHGGGILIENTFGGGYSFGPDIGGTFLHIDNVATVTIISSSSERSQKSIYTEPYGAISSQNLTIIGSVFSDPIELNGRMNFVSMGNKYFGPTFKVAPGVTVNSVGDKFCYDPAISPGTCTDKIGGGNIVNSPGFNGGQIMFRTGRLPEGTGKTRIDGQPNLFGYDVELSKGLLQYDPNMTFRDITAMAAASESAVRVKDGAIAYCKDCKKAPTGLCTQGQAGVDGAFAKRINGQWRCD